MDIDLSAKPLPPVYLQNGKECYLDPIRKKLIYITPEETIRQQVLSYLIIDLKVPKPLICVEEHLSHYNVKSSRRADIIINCITTEDEVVPIAVIECKAPGIGLGEKVSDQLIDYCNTLGCDYAMMINDSQYFCFHYENESNEYIQISALPEYSDMIEGKYLPFDPGEFPERIEFNAISDFLKDNLCEGSTDISPTTEHHLACAAFNLLDGTLDPRHKLPEKQYRLFRLIEDYGGRMMEYGNAAGGSFYGPYRSFLVEINGNTQFVSIGFSTYSTTTNPNKEKTSLNVAIDNEQESHHALQLIMDDNVTHIGNEFSFYHHGRIAIGNIGSGKTSELREFVRSRAPHLICGDKFFLGKLVNDRNWNLDDPAVTELIENLISYALIRDEYRAYVKAKYEKQRKTNTHM